MAEKSEISPEDVIVTPDTPKVLEDTVVVPAEEVEDDKILITLRDESTPDAVLNAVMWGLGEEQNSLKQLRTLKQNEGKDTSHISIKRGTLLKYMSETLLQKKALVGPDNKDLDLKGPKFREIFKMFLQIIADTFDEIKIPHEYKEMFFSALSKNLEGWEDKAQKIAKTMDVR